MGGGRESHETCPGSLCLVFWVPGAITKVLDMPSPVCAEDVPGAAQARGLPLSLSIPFCVKGPFRSWSVCL